MGKRIGLIDMDGRNFPNVCFCACKKQERLSAGARLHSG